MTIVKITRFTRVICRPNQYGFCFGYNPIKRNLSDKLLPATDYFTWNTANPVKLHMGEFEPESYEPILVQSMMKKVVEANGNRRAIVSCDGKIDWNYDQYYQEVQKAAKGFISLGKDYLSTFFSKNICISFIYYFLV